MTSAYSQLYFGLAGAIVLIYLVIVVNFQSWLDPFIIITALPAALAGIVWMLFMTGTTLSVPALTGAIMCMGIATANSILIVSFAREGMAQGLDAAAAALEAGFTRFRPVLMTALAMIIGMVPMAFALGEGGEQNAPLGRAVIGGLSGRHRGDAVLRAYGIQLAAFPERQADARAAMPSHPNLLPDRETEWPQRSTARAATTPPRPPPRTCAPRGLGCRRRSRHRGFGILQRRGHEAEVKQWTQIRRSRPSPSSPATGPRGSASDAARHCPGLVRGAHLRPRQRLSERLVLRLWRQGEERRRSRGD